MLAAVPRVIRLYLKALHIKQQAAPAQEQGAVACPPHVGIESWAARGWAGDLDRAWSGCRAGWKGRAGAGGGARSGCRVMWKGRAGAEGWARGGAGYGARPVSRPEAGSLSGARARAKARGFAGMGGGGGAWSGAGSKVRTRRRCRRWNGGGVGLS